MNFSKQKAAHQMDYNNPSDFSGRLNIIYGHHMKSGKMFVPLVGYKNQVYFDEHPYLYLYTADEGNYRIEILHGCVVGAVYGVAGPSRMKKT